MAMPFGLPVVSTNVGEMGATIKETEIGLLLPPKDTTALADALVALGRDAKLRDKFSQNAKFAMKTLYSTKILAQRISDIYSTIVSNYAAARPTSKEL